LPLTASYSFGGKILDKEWRFLCACASPLLSTSNFPVSAAAELDWNVTLELATAHGVLNLLAARLKETGFQDVPAAVRIELQNRARAKNLFTLSLTAELFRILDEFRQAGIAVIPVKGPVVSLLAYGDPGMRNYADLDFLVRQEEILPASALMRKLQFQADVPEQAIRAGKIPGEYQFTRPGTQLIVELHTENTLRYYPKPMHVDDLFARQRRVVLDGKQIPALSLEDEFLFDCIHGTKDFWERLMWAADIAAMVTRHPALDWTMVRQAAKDAGAGRMLYVALALAESLLGVLVPAPMAEEVRKDAVARRLVRQIETWMPGAGYRPPALSKRVEFRWKVAGGGFAGAAFLLRLSLSTTEEDWEATNDDRNSRFWEAVKRPFRLIRKYSQGG
jgi:hypothetical protein